MAYTQRLALQLDEIYALSKLFLHIDFFIDGLAPIDSISQKHVLALIDKVVLLPEDRSEVTVGFKMKEKGAAYPNLVLENIMRSAIDLEFFNRGGMWKVRSTRTLQHNLTLKDIGSTQDKNCNQDMYVTRVIAYKIMRIGIFELADISE